MKKSSKLPLVISIVAAVVAIALVAVIVFVVTTFMRGSSQNSTDYSATVQTLEGAQKTFAVGEVAQIGPYDVTTSSIQKDYTPSQSELDAVRNMTQKTGQYVLVTLTLKYNDARANYDKLQVSQGDWIEQMSKITLNEMAPLVVSPDSGDYQTSKKIITDATSTAGATLALLYRLPQTEAALTLSYDITIFTKVSSFVGTEGMPRKEYQYTIGIQ